MLTLLFWNMGGQLPKDTPSALVQARHARLLGILRNLTSAHKVDVLILAEIPLGEDEVWKEINVGNPLAFNRPVNSLCERIKIYPRFPHRFMSIFGASESAKYTCRHVRLPARETFLLFAAHFGSKLYQSDDSQTLAAPVFSPVIRKAEKKAEHQKTILVGDLNMNPFDAAVVGAQGLNAVMTRELALRETRVVDRQAYPFFYNPMWGHFGDATHDTFPPGHPEHEPPGTCYFGASESKWYYWNMLDQVLLRPALLPFFRNRDLKILTTDGTTSFLNARGLPDSEAVSDHLPLLFRLNL
jgi:hypothetical protein